MLVSEAKRDEVAESGRVVCIVKQDSVVRTCRLKDEAYIDREQSITNCLIGDERRTTELRQTYLCPCDSFTQHTHTYRVPQ